MAPLLVCKLCKDKGVSCAKDTAWKMTQHLQSDRHSLSWPEIEKGWKNLVEEQAEFTLKPNPNVEAPRPMMVKICIQVPIHPEADVEELVNETREFLRGKEIAICDRDSTPVPMNVRLDKVRMAKGNSVWLVPAEQIPQALEAAISSTVPYDSHRGAPPKPSISPSYEKPAASSSTAASSSNLVGSLSLRRVKPY
jgi:hypothetical protein